MKEIKELDEEIDNIIYASERGIGFGGGTGQEELDSAWPETPVSPF